MQQLVRIMATVVEKLKNLFSGKSKPVEPTVDGTLLMTQLIAQRDKAKEVAAKMTDQSVSLDASPTPTGSQQDVAKHLWLRAMEGDAKAAQELLDFKKQAKKGWKVWGIPDTATETLKGTIADAG